MSAKSVELRQKRANIADQMQVIIDRTITEKRAMTSEETQQFERMDAEQKAIKDTIDRIERQEQLDAEMRSSVNPGVRPTAGTDDRGAQGGAEEYREAFLSFLRGGNEELTSEQRSLLRTRSQATTQEMAKEMRALGIGTGAAGGFTVPQDFYNKLTSAQKAYGGMRASRATVFTTTTGATLPVPTEDDTNNKGTIVTENTQMAEQDITFGQKLLGSYLYSSKIVRVSWQLLQDSAFDVETWLAEKLGIRIARATNEHFTIGTGTSQPMGAVTAALEGKVGAAGQTTSVTYDDLVDLLHSVDPAYRGLGGVGGNMGAMNNCQLMFHDSTLKALKKLKDGYGRPLWLPGIATREPDTINGCQYIVNQDMPVMAANAKSILCGDFSTYLIRDVKDITLIRLTERYADYGQVGFLAFSRHDGLLADAGTGPIRYYQNAAS